MVPDLLGGPYKVCVDTSSLKPPNSSPGGTKAQPGDMGAAALAANKRKYVAIPDKYAAPDTTDLTYTFPGGSETFDIDLK
jgi:hypothetical protein